MNDDSLDTTRSTELSIVQVIVFPFLVNRRVSPFSTHLNITVLSEAHEAIESLAFHREIALLRTDRDHEQKLVLSRLFALSPVAVSRIWGLWTFSKYPLCLSSILFAQHCALTLPNTQWTYDVLCLWRLHGRIKRSLMFGLSLHIFLAKLHATLLVQSACREVSSGGCSSKTGAQGFRSWGSPFWTMPPDFLYLSRIQFCTRCILRISGVSRRSVQSQFFNLPKNRIHWIWVLRYTTLDLFLFRIATAPWVPSLDFALRLLLPWACRHRQLLPQMHLFPDL